MKCEEIVAQLSLLLDGDLESHISENITLHLEKCGPCLVMWNTFKKTVNLFRTYGQHTSVAVTEDIHFRLINNLRRNLTV